MKNTEEIYDILMSGGHEMLIDTNKKQKKNYGNITLQPWMLEDCIKDLNYAIQLFKQEKRSIAHLEVLINHLWKKKKSR